MTLAAAQAPLRRTPLHSLHLRLGAKMVPFAGYEMPVQYPAGILAEHLHTRAQAGLFDVSHMGQVRMTRPDSVERLQSLVPADLRSLPPMRLRYTMLLNDRGGIIDDLIVTRTGHGLHLVLNAARKELDVEHLRRRLDNPRIAVLEHRALLALQGPVAAAVLARFVHGVDRLPFRSVAAVRLDGCECVVSRSGYTGEDGFEISLAEVNALRVAELLLAEKEVMPVGLGARDSLRLEAGLCLYGHDLDEDTTPVEADLAWTIGPRRRQEGGFPGAERILHELAEGPRRRRVGLRPEGRAPAREGTEIVDDAGRAVGRVTSGGFGPSVGGPIAMGYVDPAHAAPGTALSLIVRGTPRPARVVPLPFVPSRYYRG